MVIIIKINGDFVHHRLYFGSFTHLNVVDVLLFVHKNPGWLLSTVTRDATKVKLQT